jgi:hypothetical protein
MRLTQIQIKILSATNRKEVNVAQVGDVIENPITGEKVVFKQTGS